LVKNSSLKILSGNAYALPLIAMSAKIPLAGVPAWNSKFSGCARADADRAFQVLASLPPILRFHCPN